LQTTASFLDNRADDWRDCLNGSLRFLRESWATDWVGLAFVVDACAHFLNLNMTQQSVTGAKLLTIAKTLALQIEEGAARNASRDEPHYHNRLHFADVLTIITVQVAIESTRCRPKDPDWLAAVLLIAIAHDLNHPGRVNRFCAEIEQMSVNVLRPHLQAHAVADVWVQRIEDVILASDFTLVAKNHARVSGRAFAWNKDWVSVLLNEADVMASVLEEFGGDLSRALASEWALVSFPGHRTVATAQGRRDFLATTLFSSDSASRLGAPIDRDKQLSDTST